MAVMIELDPNRLKKIFPSLNTADFDVAFGCKGDRPIPTSEGVIGPVSGFANMVRGLLQRGMATAIYCLFRLSYYLIKKLGFKVGEEVRVAVEEARLLKARVLLGDQDVQVTMERLASAVLKTKFSQ
jgi:pheromone shutdown protein TraB